jgi:hypothetical protein
MAVAILTISRPQWVVRIDTSSSSNTLRKPSGLLAAEGESIKAHAHFFMALAGLEYLQNTFLFDGFGAW